jgi:hypothetical protein
MLSGIDDAGGWLWVAILKIREPENFASIAALNETERQKLKQEMVHDLQGGASERKSGHSIVGSYLRPKWMR